jgi:hypothetical protein
MPTYLPPAAADSNDLSSKLDVKLDVATQR